jgi:HAMP domain-containing protein
VCIPVAIALAVAGTAVSAGGAIMAGNAKAAEYRQHAAIEELNLHADNRAAGDAIARGSEDVQTHSLQTSQLIGQQIAATGANGVETNYGSAAQTVSDTRLLSGIDESRIRESASREAEQYRISAENHQMQASADRSSASAAKTAGLISALGSVIAGAQQISGMAASSGAGASGGGSGGGVAYGGFGPPSFAGVPTYFRNVR